MKFLRLLYVEEFGIAMVSNSGFDSSKTASEQEQKSRNVRLAKLLLVEAQHGVKRTKPGLLSATSE